MLFDTHMHTRFSTDSQMTIRQAIARGQEIDIGIIITEHMDLEYPEPKAFIFDAEEYFKEYDQYRSDRVLLGIEIGMRSDLADQNRKLAKEFSFDYIIGSIHVIDNIDIYCERFYRHRTKQQVYHQYFQSMIDCLHKYDFIDSLGHIDYIARYARFADPEIYYHEFREHIDQILTLLASRQKAIEINTRRLDKQQVVEALLPVYRRFRELGGRLVTIGSDAHNPRDIGKEFSTALKIAETCDLRPVWFKQREPHYMSSGR